MNKQDKEILINVYNQLKASENAIVGLMEGLNIDSPSKKLTPKEARIQQLRENDRIVKSGKKC